MSLTANISINYENISDKNNASIDVNVVTASESIEIILFYLSVRRNKQPDVP